MPKFDHDIDVSDFYHECSRRDKRELIDLISDDSSTDTDLRNYVIASIDIDSEDFEGERVISTGRKTFDQLEFKKSLYSLDKNYHCLPNELIEQVNALAENFNF